MTVIAFYIYTYYTNVCIEYRDEFYQLGNGPRIPYSYTKCSIIQKTNPVDVALARVLCTLEV